MCAHWRRAQSAKRRARALCTLVQDAFRVALCRRCSRRCCALPPVQHFWRPHGAPARAGISNGFWFRRRRHSGTGKPPHPGRTLLRTPRTVRPTRTLAPLAASRSRRPLPAPRTRRRRTRRMSGGRRCRRRRRPPLGRTSPSAAPAARNSASTMCSLAKLLSVAASRVSTLRLSGARPSREPPPPPPPPAQPAAHSPRYSPRYALAPPPQTCNSRCPASALSSATMRRRRSPSLPPTRWCAP